MMTRKQKKLEEERRKANEQIERKIKIKNTIKRMNGLVQKYEAKQEELISLAAQAKLDGRERDYRSNLAVLKGYVARLEKTRSMLNQLQLAQIMSDDAELSKEFVEAMGVLAEETSKAYDGMELKTVAEKVRQTNIEVEKNQALFDSFLDELTDSFDNANEISDGNINAELESLVDSRMAAIDSNINERIKNKKII